MSPASNQYIHGLILSTAVSQWRKVAFIIGKVLDVYHNDGVRISEYAISGRIRALVEEGKLEAQGNLSRWWNSEVRLPE
jgi:hypothetical protein